MKIRNNGCTRIVFLFKSIVIKIPGSTYSWEHFLKALLGNIQENKTWKYNSGKYEKGFSHLLCPVLWCSWGGWILIMKRADTTCYIDEIRNEPQYGEDFRNKMEIRYKEWIAAGFGGDDKPDNYGYLEGRLVKIDYGC